MKTDFITMKAKQKSIEKKSYKRSKAKQAQKKNQAQNNHYNKRWGQSAVINLKEQQEEKNVGNFVSALCLASAFPLPVHTESQLRSST